MDFFNRLMKFFAAVVISMAFVVITIMLAKVIVAELGAF